jgi:hypothetical protein
MSAQPLPNGRANGRRPCPSMSVRGALAGAAID